MKPADALLTHYAQSRDLRDKLRDARNACLCERHEGVDENMEMRSQTPCWKAARKWDDAYDPDGRPSRFHFDPPIDDWCATCRQRQAFTVQLRAAVRDHAAAKRAVLRRGRLLATRSEATSKPVQFVEAK